MGGCSIPPNSSIVGAFVFLLVSWILFLMMSVSMSYTFFVYVSVSLSSKCGGGLFVIFLRLVRAFPDGIVRAFPNGIVRALEVCISRFVLTAGSIILRLVSETWL